jgi:hypothetical protein
MQRIVPAFSVTAALLITAAMFAASNPPRFHKPQLTEIVVNLNAIFDYGRYQREKTLPNSGGANVWPLTRIRQCIGSWPIPTGIGPDPLHPKVRPQQCRFSTKTL